MLAEVMLITITLVFCVTIVRKMNKIVSDISVIVVSIGTMTVNSLLIPTAIVLMLIGVTALGYDTLY